MPNRPDGRPNPTGARGRAATWLTIAAFGVLGLAALAVFVVLPDWVRDRHQAPTEVAGDPEPQPPLSESIASEPAIETPTDGALIDPPVAQVPPAALSPAVPSPAVPPPATFVAATPAKPTRDRDPAMVSAKPRRGKAESGDFKRAMSEGLTALDNGDYTTAREAFARAAALQPGSPQSADGLARAEAGARLSAISTLRDQALAAESQEDWHAALGRYDEALELDSAVEFAIAGHARSQRRGELSDRIDYHLAKPTRLAADEVLQEAQAILDQASEIEPAGPELKRQREQLADVVTAFSTPVTATLESDQLTEVMVYKVGRLGSFNRHALDLRPGTYTVVGSRRGFRDVRRQLVIEPGVAPRPLAIRCEEKI